MDLGLSGKRAVVLAASEGLGYAAADALAREGCRLAICSRRKKAVKDAARRLGGSGVFAAVCDVSRAASLDAFFRRALEALGGVDILVANAGGPPPGRAESMTDARWRGAFELTLMSVVRSVRHVLPAMKKQNAGRIIINSSVSVMKPLPNMVLSNSLRAAVAGYARTLAAEVAPANILVHLVLPGSFLTQRNRDLGVHAAKSRGITYSQVVKEWRAKVPLGRMGEPEEFGSAVAFLASDRFSFSTGVALPIDGGALA